MASSRLYGFPRLTADADITPATDDANIERLAKALKKLDARVYTESVPEGLAFDCSGSVTPRFDVESRHLGGTDRHSVQAVGHRGVR